MTLAEYVERHFDGNWAAFGRRLGRSKATMSRLRRGTIPGPALVVAIYAATDRAVTPNDLYGVADAAEVAQNEVSRETPAPAVAAE